MKVIFDPFALAEMREAAAFYDESRPGLGDAFLDEVEAATTRIVQYPFAAARMQKRYRRRLLHTFPYGLVYSVSEDAIYIAAVMHLKRKPGYWLHR